ncbi:N-acetylneuraminate lyase [Mycoplasmoides fastidiosum]|uniref:N-acetylneuraminate lyase n=1 Tax=Mycoplasmoides fastidiosum TaxID=92758 RepID=A0ABU0LYT6_9BACT|nr:N-acetylneuraminate lyase [Mycoplasmoides fastidiosum]MDQ0513878.1 N-acetylneuraminate lyase [Mycoplasmoides fastidiosum]UUD37708.1 N-acetylneuraminate lyase [Mycoplasmoides fastidiosum]
MNTTKFDGIFPALITPFDQNGRIKENGLREIVRYLINVQKVDGIYATGSTGEFLLLTPQDKKRVLEIVAEEAKGKITLIAQIGSLNLDEVKELAQYAEQLGYDAISAITPYYYNFSFEEVKSYYEEIAKASNLPMFIYYLPQLAGGKVTLEQFGELLNIKHVIGSKYGSTDLYFFERLLGQFRDKIFMFAFDEALSAGLLLGARGFIGSTYNVNAQGARSIIEAFNNKDMDLLRRRVHIYNDYINALLSKGLMQTLKAIMQLDGVDAGVNKKPFKLIDSDELKKYAQEIKTKYLG